MMKIKFMKSQLLVPPWKRISMCAWHVIKHLQLTIGSKSISKKSIGSCVSLSFPCEHISQIMTAREAGSISFWGSNKIISPVFQNPLMTYLNPKYFLTLFSLSVSFGIGATICTPREIQYLPHVRFVVAPIVRVSYGGMTEGQSQEKGIVGKKRLISCARNYLCVLAQLFLSSSYCSVTTSPHSRHTTGWTVEKLGYVRLRFILPNESWVRWRQILDVFSLKWFM